MTLESATVVGNVADDDESGVGDGGGIYLTYESDLVLRNSVIGDNVDQSPADPVASDLYQDLPIFPASITTQGYNLISSNLIVDTEFPVGQPNLNGDWVGTELAPFATGLGTLGVHGGPTLTHLPAASSPAVDHGSCPGDLRDQRRFGDPVTDRRPVDIAAAADVADGWDIGAVERGASLLGEPALFEDGFETGDTSTWSVTEP